MKLKYTVIMTAGILVGCASSSERYRTACLLAGYDEFECEMRTMEFKNQRLQSVLPIIYR